MRSAIISGRLKLPWDEFNRVSIAGITNTTRLSQMLDSAASAFLIMTAEDEQSDGKLRARMNVIHEAGFFQGRLGFTRALILMPRVLGWDSTARLSIGVQHQETSELPTKHCFELISKALIPCIKLRSLRTYRFGKLIHEPRFRARDTASPRR